MNIFTVLLTVIILWDSTCYGYSVVYRDAGVSEDDSPLCKHGKRQSPIDLGPTAKTKIVNSLPLNFVNYDLIRFPVIIGLDGHIVDYSLSELKNEGLYLTGSILNGERYNFFDLHLHWAIPYRPGTEHAFYGKRYTAELHLIHINSRYSDLSEALNHTDGVLVLGALLVITSDPPPITHEYLFEVTATGEDTADFKMSFDKFNRVDSLYHYNGSLTTPPCTEHVKWIIPANLFSMNCDSIDALRKLSAKDNRNSNVRPLQMLNDRSVSHYVLKNKKG